MVSEKTSESFLEMEKELLPIGFERFQYDFAPFHMKIRKYTLSHPMQPKVIPFSHYKERMKVYDIKGTKPEGVS